MESEPILVRAAVEENTAPEEHEEADVVAKQRQLSVTIPEEVLLAISKKTTDLQARLDNFVTGLNAKIQSLTSRTSALVQAHQTQSFRTVAEAQHCMESLKLLIEEYEEIEAGWEEVKRVREIVNGLKQRVDKLEQTLN